MGYGNIKLSLALSIRRHSRELLLNAGTADEDFLDSPVFWVTMQKAKKPRVY